MSIGNVNLNGSSSQSSWFVAPTEADIAALFHNQMTQPERQHLRNWIYMQNYPAHLLQAAQPLMHPRMGNGTGVLLLVDSIPEGIRAEVVQYLQPFLEKDLTRDATIHIWNKIVSIWKSPGGRAAVQALMPQNMAPASLSHMFTLLNHIHGEQARETIYGLIPRLMLDQLDPEDRLEVIRHFVNNSISSDLMVIRLERAVGELEHNFYQDPFREATIFPKELIKARILQLLAHLSHQPFPLFMAGLDHLLHLDADENEALREDVESWVRDIPANERGARIIRTCDLLRLEFPNGNFDPQRVRELLDIPMSVPFSSALNEISPAFIDYDFVPFVAPESPAPAEAMQQSSASSSSSSSSSSPLFNGLHAVLTEAIEQQGAAMDVEAVPQAAGSSSSAVPTEEDIAALFHDRMSSADRQSLRRIIGIMKFGPDLLHAARPLIHVKLDYVCIEETLSILKKIEAFPEDLRVEVVQYLRPFLEKDLTKDETVIIWNTIVDIWSGGRAAVKALMPQDMAPNTLLCMKEALCKMNIIGSAASSRFRVRSTILSLIPRMMLDQLDPEDRYEIIKYLSESVVVKHFFSSCNSTTEANTIAYMQRIAHSMELDFFQHPNEDVIFPKQLIKKRLKQVIDYPYAPIPLFMAGLDQFLRFDAPGNHALRLGFELVVRNIPENERGARIVRTCDRLRLEFPNGNFDLDRVRELLHTPISVPFGPIQLIIQQRKANALARLDQIQAMVGALSSHFVCHPDLAKFDLDAFLAARYAINVHISGLFQFIDWADVKNDGSWRDNDAVLEEQWGLGHYPTPVNRENYEVRRRSWFERQINEYSNENPNLNQYRVVKALLRNTLAYFTQERARVTPGSPQEAALKERFRTFYKNFIDASHNCVDQVLSQAETFILDMAVAANGSTEAISPQQQLFNQACLALCKYRTELLTGILHEQDLVQAQALRAQDQQEGRPVRALEAYQEKHMADLQRIAVKKLAERLHLQGTLVNAGAQFFNNSDRLQAKATAAVDAFMLRYKPEQYLLSGATQALIDDPRAPAIRLLTEWAKNAYALENEDPNGPLMDQKLASSEGHGFPISMGGIFTAPGAALLMEAAGLLVPRPASSSSSSSSNIN